MDVLLLSDIPGIGKKNDLIVVTSGYAMNYLLPQRKAIVVTPNVRKQYGEEIKQRAMERETERQLHLSLANTLSGKVIHVAAKAAKNGKLYAALTEATIAEALKKEYGIDVPVSTIHMNEHMKTAGQHAVTIAVGIQKTSVTVEVKALTENEAVAA